jgi:hypothetical protein
MTDSPATYGDQIIRANMTYLVVQIRPEHLGVTDLHGRLRQFKITRLIKEMDRGTTKLVKA